MCVCVCVRVCVCVCVPAFKAKGNGPMTEQCADHSEAIRNPQQIQLFSRSQALSTQGGSFSRSGLPPSSHASVASDTCKTMEFRYGLFSFVSRIAL